jgi:hypothetical protein
MNEMINAPVPSRYPAFSATALRLLNPSNRQNQINQVVEQNIKRVYDAILSYAKQGRLMLRWEEWQLVTTIDLTNEERNNVKYRIKLGLMEKFPEVQVNVDEPLSFMEFSWA